MSRKIRIVRFLSGRKPGSTRVSSICSTTRVTVNGGYIGTFIMYRKKYFIECLDITFFFLFFFFAIREILSRFWYRGFFFINDNDRV